MEKRINPIQILREFTIVSKPIVKTGQYLNFGDVRLKLDTPTAFRQRSTNKQYRLGSIWFYLKYKEDQLATYINECNKEKIECISALDKQPILDYFISGFDEVDILDQELIPKTIVIFGKKKRDDLEKIMESTINEDFENLNKEDYKKLINSHSNLNNNIKLGTTHTYNKEHNLAEEDPNLKIMEYVFNKEKKLFNRNTTLRPLNNLISFDSLIQVSKKTFMRSSKPDKTQENMSFLDELLTNESISIIYTNNRRFGREEGDHCSSGDFCFWEHKY